MIKISTFCTPVKVYMILAAIITLISLVLGIFFQGLIPSLISLLVSIAWMIICTIILLLICKYAGKLIPWIIVIIIAIIQLLMIGGYMAKSIL